MTVLSIIVGVLLIIGGFCCMFTPVGTFLATGYFLGIILLVFGIVGIVRGFQKQAKALEVVVSVLAVIVGVFALFRPGSTMEFDRILLYLIAAWFTIEGIVSIVLAIQVKDINSGWYWGLIFGILAVLVGIYAFAHPMFTAVTTGILVGIFFITAGFELISFAFALSDAGID